MACQEEGQQKPSLQELQQRMIVLRDQALIASGLVDADAQWQQALRASSAAKRSSTSGKRARAAAADEEPVAASRRSTRVAALPAVDYSDDSNSNGGRSNSTSTAAANAAGPPSSSPSATSSTSSSSAVPGPLRPPPPPTPGMLKTLDARLDYMRDTYLGRPVPVSLAGSGNQAKAAVIWTVCGQRPGFNKYAGCAEYRNAMVLFVNISEEGSGAFNNQFLEGGRTITWFASPSKHENSNDVLRLVHHANGFPPRESEDSAAAGAAPTAAAAASAEFTLAPARVALACRFPGEPYLWCGELEFRSMAAGSRPLQLTFRLADHAQLAASSEFQRMVKGLEG